jgi:hypothetical protein
MHALCFHLRGTQIVSLYEHHTGELTAAQIEDFTQRLIAGALPHEAVFNTKGHGVYYAATSPVGAQHPTPTNSLRYRRAAHNAAPTALPLIAVTGPQRAKLRGSRLNPYFAVPHGDMMVSGCFGLLWAVAEKHPQFAPDILPALGLPRSS